MYFANVLIRSSTINGKESALLESTYKEQGIYTRFFACPRIFTLVRRKLASWIKASLMCRAEKERERKMKERTQPTIPYLPFCHSLFSPFWRPQCTFVSACILSLFIFSSSAARTCDFNHSKVGMANLRTVTDTI